MAFEDLEAKASFLATTADCDASSSTIRLQVLRDTIWSMQLMFISVLDYLHAMAILKLSGNTSQNLQRLLEVWAQHQSTFIRFLWVSREVAENICDAAEELDQTFRNTPNMCLANMHEPLFRFQSSADRYKLQAQRIADKIKQLSVDIELFYENLESTVNRTSVRNILSRFISADRQAINKANAALEEILPQLLSIAKELRGLAAAKDTCPLAGALASNRKRGEDAFSAPKTDPDTPTASDSLSEKATTITESRVTIMTHWMNVIAELKVVEGTIKLALRTPDKSYMMKALEGRLKNAYTLNATVRNVSHEIRVAAFTQQPIL
ncbi:unnamed protein product [Somion occarium]|uniref:Uncharacterized protein n=1 Tax=Somion occarium TaxID=3059160 RepID=A0ABP1E6B8_9APHY